VLIVIKLIFKVISVFVLIVIKLIFKVINVTFHREPRVMTRRVLVRSAA